MRENVVRLKSRLRRNTVAMQWLLSTGLTGATVDRLHLGLKEPYSPRDGSGTVEEPLCFPLVDEALRPQSRYAYLRVPGVTSGGPEVRCWGPGQCATYRLGPASAAFAVVSADVVDCWLAWQECGGATAHDAAFLSRSHSAGLPAEWRTSEFWAGFGQIVVLPGEGALDLLRALSPHVGSSLSLCELPVPCVTLGQARKALAGGLMDLVRSAREWVPDVASRRESIPEDCAGRFAAEPIDITGAHVAGLSYYPFSVENRAVEGVLDGGRLVQSYETLVLRSDGRLLEVRSMPAPRGTEAGRRVTALSDGTRIATVPRVGQRSTWSLASIENYIRWTRGGERPFRSLSAIMADVEDFLRSRVGLPHDAHYLLAAGYVVLSHVFQVFDAIPLLLITGPSGSGKSELAEAMARLGFNACMAGQLRAAGMIRLLDETRGLLVLDDVDGVGSASVTGPGELAQTLKMAYKRSTARKPLADRGGRVRVADFYGPKVLTNVGGVDQVLGSRLLVVRTAVVEERVGAAWTEAALDDLRDELHCWGLAEAAGVAEAYRSFGGLFRDRRQEIVTPMLTLARHARDEELEWRMAGLLAEPATYWTTPAAE